MRKTKLICFAAVVLAVGVGWAGGGELAPVACEPDLAVFPAVMLQGSVADKAGTGVAGLSSRAITGELILRAKPGSTNESSIRFALDYSKEDAANPDLLLIDFNGSGKFDPAKAIALRPTKTPRKSIDYQADFGPAGASALRQGKTFPLLLRGAVLRLQQGPNTKQYMVVISIAPAIQGKCRFGQTEHTLRLIDNTGDFRFDCKGAYDRKKPGPMGIGTGDIVLVDTTDSSFARPAAKAFYGQPVRLDGQWYNLTISADGNKVVAEKLDLPTGQLQTDADKWELILHHNGQLTMFVGDSAPLSIPAGQYNIVYCRRWSTPNAQGQRSWLLAMDRQFLMGKDSPSSITIAPEKKLLLPIGAPLSTSMTATPKGGTVEFSLKTPTIQPGLSVATVVGNSGDPYSQANQPKVRLTDANGKVIDELTMEYG